MLSSRDPFLLAAPASERSNCESTPYEKAAARVPPPEKARPISRSSPSEGMARPSSREAAAASAVARGMLIGSLQIVVIVAQLARVVAYSAAAATRVNCGAERIDNASSQTPHKFLNHDDIEAQGCKRCRAALKRAFEK